MKPREARVRKMTPSMAQRALVVAPRSVVTIGWLMGGLSGLTVGDAIDAAGALIGEVERAVASHHQVHRTTPRGRALEPAGGEVLRRARRMPVVEADPDDLVAGRQRAVPRAAVGHEEAAAVLLGEVGPGEEGSPDGGGVGRGLGGGGNHLVEPGALPEGGSDLHLAGNLHPAGQAVR